MHANTTARLAQGIDLWGVVALGLGTAFGVAIFSAIAPAAALAGPGMLVSVLIAALPMYLIAISYAFLGAAVPVSGASYVWPSRFLHPELGFYIAWARIVANMGAMVVLALVLVRYVAMVVAVPTRPTMLAVLALALLANLFGVHIATRVQKALMVLMLAVFAVFVVWGGAGAVHVARLVPLFPHGMKGVLAAVPLLLGLFFGIEAATEAGGEVADSRRAIPLGIAVSIGSAVALCLVISFVALGVLGADGLGASPAPILSAAERFMGPVAKPLIVTAAVLSIGKSLNAMFALFSRSLYAMGADGTLPAALGRVHPRWHTPHVALLTVFGIGCVGLFLPQELTFLFLAVNIPNLVKYACVCLSAARVARAQPGAVAASGLPLRARTLVWAGWAGAGCAAALALLGLGTDARPYGLLLGWLLVGWVFRLMVKRGPRAAEQPDNA